MQNTFLKRLKDTQAITVLVLIKTGSRYEDNSNLGVAHFIEHLLFKGTKKRVNSLAITKELDGIGAEFNAFTSKDKTGFYVKAAKEHLELALDILSDMLFNSKFDEKEINKERGVVLEEFNMYYDNPTMFIDSLLESSVFSGHVLGKLILGEKEIIKNISRSNILKFYKKYYRYENLMIGVSGNFEEKEATNLIKKYFKITKFNPKNNFEIFKSKQNKFKIILQNKPTDQVHTALGFSGISYKDKDFYSAKLLSLILGGNMSSRLFLKLREKMGLCYHIRAYCDNYEDSGMFSIMSGLDKDRIEKAIEYILIELNNIKTKKVSQKELLMAKEYVKGKLILNLEDSAHVVDWYLEHLIFDNKEVSPQDVIKSIEKVTIDDIHRVANRIFQKEKINLAVIGPFENEWKIKFEKIINKIKL